MSETGIGAFPGSSDEGRKRFTRLTDYPEGRPGDVSPVPNSQLINPAFRQSNDVWDFPKKVEKKVEAVYDVEQRVPPEIQQALHRYNEFRDQLIPTSRESRADRSLTEALDNAQAVVAQYCYERTPFIYDEDLLRTLLEQVDLGTANLFEIGLTHLEALQNGELPLPQEERSNEEQTRLRDLPPNKIVAARLNTLEHYDFPSEEVYRRVLFATETFLYHELTYVYGGLSEPQLQSWQAVRTSLLEQMKRLAKRLGSSEDPFLQAAFLRMALTDPLEELEMFEE